MKLASYNIQYGIGMDGRFDPARIAASIADADIIALQEVTRGFARNGHVDLVAEMAGFFPEYFHAFAAPCDVFVGMVEIEGRKVERRFQFGNMVLSRWPILTVRSLLLPRSRTFDRLNLQRGAIEAVIDAPGGPLRVYSVHLDHVSPDERIRQIRFLKDRAMNFQSEGGALTGGGGFGLADPPLAGDFIMLGDFNMIPESPEYLDMVGHCDSDGQRALRADRPVDALARFGAVTAGSYTWAKPPGEGTETMHLDHAFVNPQLVPRLVSAGVDHEALGSDHFPIRLELS